MAHHRVSGVGMLNRGYFVHLPRRHALNRDMGVENAPVGTEVPPPVCAPRPPPAVGMGGVNEDCACHFGRAAKVCVIPGVLVCSVSSTLMLPPWVL